MDCRWGGIEIKLSEDKVAEGVDHPPIGRFIGAAAL